MLKAELNFMDQTIGSSTIDGTGLLVCVACLTDISFRRIVNSFEEEMIIILTLDKSEVFTLVCMSCCSSFLAAKHMAYFLKGIIFTHLLWISWFDSGLAITTYQGIHHKQPVIIGNVMDGIYCWIEICCLWSYAICALSLAQLDKPFSA